MKKPTIFEAAGGAPALARLTDKFYESVRNDAMLAPVFAAFTPEHAANVAIWMGEVFGGPPLYSTEHGGHRTILEKHQGLHLTEAQRARWAELMIAAAREVLPPDAALQQRFAEYIDWGSRIAVAASQPGFRIDRVGPVPHWDWVDD